MWRENPITVINHLLLVLVVLLTAAAPLFLWYDSTAVASRVRMPEPAAPSLEQASKPSTVVANKSYAKVAARRRFFRMKARETPAEPASPLSAAEVPGLAQRYTLLGVLMGEVPRAIVRENSTNTSMFLSKGQDLDGYLVQEIFSDHILLQRDGDLINLRM